MGAAEAIAGAVLAVLPVEVAELLAELLAELPVGPVEVAEGGLGAA